MGLACQPRDLLEPDVGYAQRWKPATRHMIVSGYGRWLNHLSITGLFDPAHSPAERATKENVASYIESMEALGLADYTRAGRLQQLGNALRAIAPAPDNWAWLLRASSRVHQTAKPVRNQQAKMQPVELVVKLGFDLMHAAEHDRFRTPTERAVLYRDGLLLAFQAMRPIRIANTAMIQLDHHLRRVGDGWRVYFAAHELKAGEGLEFAWPLDLQEQLERYLKDHRPTLLKGAGVKSGPQDGLWISKQGFDMGEDAIAFQNRSRTKEELGVAINVHSHRHIAATTIATFSPSCSADIMAILGHASMRPSEKHYNKASIASASANYQTTIANLRAESGGA